MRGFFLPIAGIPSVIKGAHKIRQSFDGDTLNLEEVSLPVNWLELYERII